MQVLACLPFEYIKSLEYSIMQSRNTGKQSLTKCKSPPLFHCQSPLFYINNAKTPISGQPYPASTTSFQKNLQIRKIDHIRKSCGASPKNQQKQNKHKLFLQPNFSSCTLTPKNYQSPVIEQGAKVDTFKFMYQIGLGGFGKVWKVQNKANWDFYAMKEIKKRKVIEKDSVECIKNERKVLSTLCHPFLVNMKCAFQNEQNLYLVMDYLKGADLRYHMCYRNSFSEAETKFLIGCLILALQDIHSKGIIHRDIKPQNLVLEETGYLRLTDFGIAKYEKDLNAEKFDSSGTPGYMAPEVMQREVYSQTADFFAIGVICYELMLGKRPYVGKNRKQIKQKMIARQQSISESQIKKGWSKQSALFINQLLVRSQKERLGSQNGIQQLKQHKWMKDINWKKLLKKQIVPPFIPGIVCESKEFLEEIQTYCEMSAEESNKNCTPLSQSEDSLFAGYYFSQESHISTPFRNVKNTFHKSTSNFHISKRIRRSCD